MSIAAEKVEVDSSRLWKAGGIVIVLAVVANLVIVSIAKALFSIPEEFLPLGTLRYSFFTVVGMVGAIIVYGLLLKYSQKPVRTFRIIGWIFLILSMIPDLLLLVIDFMPGSTVASVTTLMLTHLAPGLIAIYGLPRLTEAK